MNTIEITKEGGNAIVKMNRGKVNAINQEMVDELLTTFEALAIDESVKGVILTGQSHIFSAGLDVVELYGYDRAQIEKFFIAFGSLHIALAKFEKPLIAAITGHSPAGGCVLVIACDYRVMADDEKFRIGLNEVAVNVQISQNLVEAYAFWLGKGPAYRYILEGRLLSPAEALQSGLVNEICPIEKVKEEATNMMEKYRKANPKIFSNTKKKLRQSWLSNISDNAAEDLKESMEIWWDPEVRLSMEAFVSQLKGK